MELYRKYDFHWKEPREFVAYREAELSRRTSWRWPLLKAAILAVAVLLLWIAYKFTGAASSFWKALASALIVGWFAGYAQPWLVRYFPSHVFIGNGLIQVRRWSMRLVHVADVKSYEWEQAPRWHVLTLTLNSGMQLRLGVPRELAIEKVSQHLEGYGIERKQAAASPN